MNDAPLQYKIDQLRKDKIIYATEATATDLVCLFVFLFSNEYFSGVFKNAINVLVLLIAVGYTLYMGVGNHTRLQKIIKLESKLKNK